MFAKLATAAATMLLASAAIVHAEGDPPPGDSYNPGPVEASLTKGDITSLQRTALYRPRGPVPGYYRLRAVHSGNCVTIHGGSNQFDLQERPHQEACYDAAPDPANPNGQLFALLPHPSGGYTVRTPMPVRFNGRQAVPGQISNCLTVAPGVVIGPARIEARACEVPSGSGWDKAGNEEQRFLIQEKARGAWELQLIGGNAESPDCLAARGGSRDVGSDYIKWGCNGNADQRFELQWIAALPATLEAGPMKASKWHMFADGPHWLSPANGVDLLGPSYASFETIADGGDYCMKRCAELNECKAWTWTSSGYRGQSKPMCSWKREPGTAVNRGRGNYGKIFSGIVRP